MPTLRYTAPVGSQASEQARGPFWRVGTGVYEMARRQISGSPVPFSDRPGTAVHVFARGADNHLLEFYKDAGSWVVFDHTPDPGIDGRTVASSPAVDRS